MANRKNLRSLAKQAVPKKVDQALEFIRDRRGFIRSFNDFDDFIFRGENIDRKASSAIEHNLRLVRARLAEILWRNDVFLGIDIIDHLLFDIARSKGDKDIVDVFLKFIQKKGIHRAGFVLYPLHSFGVLGLGFHRFFRKSLPQMVLAHAGLCITAQTHTTEGTLAFLELARNSFDISARIPTDTVEHFIRSRPLRWIENNPLMALRVRSFSGTYYENQFIYMLKLRMCTALVMMLSVMEDRQNSDKELVFGSSARVNNWQTLDIKHYLTFETPVGKRKQLSAYCIPMNAARLELAHLSDLNVDIDPAIWSTAKAEKRLVTLTETMSHIEKGFLQHSMLGGADKVKARVYRKLVVSIDAFRRSLSAGMRHEEAVVSLAIAFETLLTDHYAARVTERIARRVRICLKGTRGTLTYQQSVSQLFQCRGAIVHKGTAPRLTTMRTAHQTYVLCLGNIVARLGGLPNKHSAPIGYLLND